jgi:hypothetical protein
LARRRLVFIRRSEYVGAPLGEIPPPPSRTFTHSGILFSSTEESPTPTWSFKEGWAPRVAAELRQWTLTGPFTPRAISRVAGLAIWIQRVADAPEFILRPVISRLAAHMRAGVDEHKVLPADVGLNDWVVTLAEVLASTPIFTRLPLPRLIIRAYSDASLSGWGWVSYGPLRQSAGRWKRKSDKSGDITFLEAVAAFKAVVSLTSRGPVLLELSVDNEALAFDLASMRSHSPRVEAVLRSIYERLRTTASRLVPGWIPTGLNPSDSLSRGLPLTALSAPPPNHSRFLLSHSHAQPLTDTQSFLPLVSFACDA